MTTRVVHIDRAVPDNLRFFNDLAEDIWRYFRDDPRVDCDLHAVDDGSDTLVVTTRVSLKGRTIQSIRKIVIRSGMENDVTIEEG